MKTPVKMTAVCSAMLAFLTMMPVHAQEVKRDKAVMVASKNEFLDSLKTLLPRFAKAPPDTSKKLIVDLSSLHGPANPREFTSVWHFPPISQAFSGMCWCFSGTSFFESEIARQTGRKIKLSELYTVYWEYVEKARRFVQERGNSAFGQGSEANAIGRIWKVYGIVPAEAYTGLIGGQRVHDHDVMFAEMKHYLTQVKESGAWDEAAVLNAIRAIMNHYIGAPPEHVTIDGKSLTPMEYFTTVVRLNIDDYIDIMSLMEKPYFQYVEHDVPDNWWHSRDYCNVPLDLFMSTITHAIRKGYSVAIGGDTSEPGLDGHAGVAMIPTFDIPSQYIDESARNFRYRNGTTGDDHGIHIVGFKADGGKDWFLVKDSGSGSRNNTHPGYMFYHEDYVKLKMLTVMVHKDAAKDILAQIRK